MLLYKYRSLTNFKNFVDIIVNHRLYAATYTDLNDPMEGQYYFRSGYQAEAIIEKLKGEKKKLGICSLSRTPDHPLMWAHYADGNRGVVIGVEINRGKYDVRQVSYDGPVSLFNDPAELVGLAAKEILSHKHPVWEYEEEERVFVEGTKFVHVRVREVILGSRMNQQDRLLVKRLLESMAPQVRIIEPPKDKIA